ncbi:MAG: class I SAM-dependent methyltransferase [Roseovarius sp.]|nr:class I SAM-dependent methyltransferase [Roseovarius sp.]
MQVDAHDYWRCPDCEATFLDPVQLPNRSVEDAQYRLHRNGLNDAGYRKFLARLTSPLLERLPAGLSGLDYGCGPGPALAAMLTEAGHRVAIYDPLFFDDPKLLDDQYDFITCTEVAEHFHHPFDEFARLDAMLKPGGWLAVMTMFQTEDAAFARWHYRRDPTHVVFYRETTFRVIATLHHWRCEIPCVNVALLSKPRLKSAPPSA